MSVLEDSMKAAVNVAKAAANFCKTMMRLLHPSDYKETREEQFVSDWFITRKMDREPTYADAIEWADKTMIDKACDWLERGGYFVNNTETIDDFRKAMEG